MKYFAHRVSILFLPFLVLVAMFLVLIHIVCSLNPTPLFSYVFCFSFFSRFLVNCLVHFVYLSSLPFLVFLALSLVLIYMGNSLNLTPAPLFLMFSNPSFALHCLGHCIYILSLPFLVFVAVFLFLIHIVNSLKPIPVKSLFFHIFLILILS